jgi:hypothetical protein
MEAASADSIPVDATKDSQGNSSISRRRQPISLNKKAERALLSAKAPDFTCPTPKADRKLDLLAKPQSPRSSAVGTHCNPQLDYQKHLPEMQVLARRDRDFACKPLFTVEKNNQAEVPDRWAQRCSNLVHSSLADVAPHL